MKFYFKYILGLLVFISLISCGGDDDICLSTEATPRLKIKFRNNSDNKIIRLDSLRIDVDYGNGIPKNMIKMSNADSVTVPLRVDNSTFTDIYVSKSIKGPKSKVRINYTTEAIYVSPACGYKKLYHNVNPELLVKDPVLNVESPQNVILDENKAHLYLKF